MSMQHEVKQPHLWRHVAEDVETLRLWAHF